MTTTTEAIKAECRAAAQEAAKSDPSCKRCRRCGARTVEVFSAMRSECYGHGYYRIHADAVGVGGRILGSEECSR